MVPMEQLTQSGIKKRSVQTHVSPCSHQTCASFQPLGDENITAATMKSRPAPVWPPFLHSSRWAKSICACVGPQGPEERTVSRRRGGCVPPVVPKRGGIFSPPPPASAAPHPAFARATPIKSGFLSLTLSRPVDNTPLSGGEKSKVATDGRAAGIP